RCARGGNSRKRRLLGWKWECSCGRVSDRQHLSLTDGQFVFLSSRGRSEARPRDPLFFLFESEMSKSARQNDYGMNPKFARSYTMKFICLGYYDPKKFEAYSDNERNAMFDKCFAYDDQLKNAGHWAGGEALELPTTAKTLRGKSGKVAVTDGPYAETKEQIGGI